MKTKLIAKLINLLVRLLNITYRFQFKNLDVVNSIRAQHQNTYLYGLWHQNLLAAICSEIGNPHVVIVSPSKDGELVAVTCQYFGNQCARGSSSRDGKKAMEEMVQIGDDVPETKGPPIQITVCVDAHHAHDMACPRPWYGPMGPFGPICVIYDQRSL